MWRLFGLTGQSLQIVEVVHKMAAVAISAGSGLAAVSSEVEPAELSFIHMRSIWLVHCFGSAGDG